jgi:2,4-dienoyl-CoA reductase-like NADH-dependent reductase (Old Yellow Enzyme family)
VIDYYAERAKGGVGLIIVKLTSVMKKAAAPKITLPRMTRNSSRGSATSPVQ